MDRPKTQYVSIEGVGDIAYQVFGSGPIDLLHCFGIGSNLELDWDMWPVAQFFQKLSEFCRVILFDRRGTGVSERVNTSTISTWEEWADDLGAVLDAVGSERAAVMMSLDAGSLAMLYAVTHPERVSALVLWNTAAKYMKSDDYPVGVPQDATDALISMTADNLGSPELTAIVAPSLSHDAELMSAISRAQRASWSPRHVRAQYQYILRDMDVRTVLPSIQVPTLVLHTQGNPMLPVELGRYLADHIAGAKFVELPGSDLIPSPQNMPLMVAEVSELVTGVRPLEEVDRVLTTVMFTDIVGSTQRAASLGDHRWRELLDHHDRLVRDRLRQFRGNEINTTGDGFVASFDGPARAIRCAVSTSKAAQELGLNLRTGIHTGECEWRGSDLAGLAVHIAARVGALAEPREVLVSSTVKDLVAGSGIDFVPRGEHELKGVPGSWNLFAVAGDLR